MMASEPEPLDDFEVEMEDFEETED